jgi:hypothetical protein
MTKPPLQGLAPGPTATAAGRAPDTVPRSLRAWFVIHFWADMVFALPLFLAPRATLGFFGWQAVDPAATRIAAAALFGIGIQSLLGRKDGIEAFRALLTLKVIWSGTATLGLLWTQLQGAPAAGWLFVAIFAGFNLVWTRYRLQLRQSA